MAFFKKIFDKKPPPGLQLGAEKRLQQESDESSDEDVDGGMAPLSCPQLNIAARRGGLDGGIASVEQQNLHGGAPVRRSR